MFLPMALSQAADALVSIHRIQGLLLADELGTRTIQDAPEELEKIRPGISGDESVVIPPASAFVWDEAPEDDTPAKKDEEGKKERRKSVATSGSEGTKKEDEHIESMFEGPMGKAKMSAPLGTTMLNARVEAPGFVEAAGKAAAAVDAVKAGEHNFRLMDIDLRVPRGALIAVVGAVGSGKSSLIQAIIGEMRCESDTAPVVRGKTSYAPQTAWIVNDTLRGNIVFGNEFDEERYARTIQVCALERDLAMLPAGDKTEVGERGINLSGGQKARLSLARATYDALSRKCPGECVVVLDDPLSAVDAWVLL
jgi:ABC-type multidrug transport system fused ATPase/permease subunit